MTEAEKLLWTELKNKKLGVRFLRQYSINEFVVDFYCPKIKLCVEVDGITHSSTEERENDRIRQQQIEEYIISFLRFTNNEVFGNMYYILDSLKSKIIELS